MPSKKKGGKAKAANDGDKAATEGDEASTAAEDSTACSGVSIETITEGDANMRPADGDMLTMHYVGTLTSDGSEFDSSRAKGTPFHFRLGVGAVIKGWDIGVKQMSLGQRAKLTIGSAMGYGAKGCTSKEASGTGVIPPNSDLTFDVELLDINGSVSLSKYRATLQSWFDAKLTAFDNDKDTSGRQVRAGLIDKHGDRDSYVDHLQSIAKAKYEGEQAKKGSRAPPWQSLTVIAIEAGAPPVPPPPPPPASD